MSAGDEPEHGPEGDRLVAKVLDAAHVGMPDQARLALHPYLHWTDASGTVVRGRTRVVTMLERRDRPLEQPRAVELRDGQIYRWSEPPS
jgi:hypothetical protein